MMKLSFSKKMLVGAVIALSMPGVAAAARCFATIAGFVALVFVRDLLKKVAGRYRLTKTIVVQSALQNTNQWLTSAASQ